MATRMNPIDPEDVEVGMHVFSVEYYSHGSTIIFKGHVQSVGLTEEGRAFAQLRGIPYFGTAGRHPLKIELFEVIEEES